MRIIGNDPSVPRQTQEVASGTLPNGKPVIVNADGTVSVVAETALSQIVGADKIFESAAISFTCSIFDSNSNKVVIAYEDKGNSNYGTAVVGTVSSDDITFGTPVVFESATVGNMGPKAITFDSSSNKVVINYADEGNSDVGTSIVGTVSGTSISFGTAVVFNNNPTYEIGSTFDSTNNRVVICYGNGGDSAQGYAIVGTVSGTSISFGSAVEYEGGESKFNSAAFDPVNGKVVIAYMDDQDSDKGKAVVATVSGTSISFGSIAEFNTGITVQVNIAYDSSSGKMLIAFSDSGDSSKGKAIVGTISGTSISFGSEAEFESGQTNHLSVASFSAASQVAIFYRDLGDSDKGKVNMATISGTSVSFGGAVDITGGAISYSTAVNDTNSNQLVFVYVDNANFSYGTANVFQPVYTTQNLTSENYIGMSSGTAFQTGSAASVGSPTAFVSADSGVNDMAFDSSNNKVVIAYRDTNNYGYAVVATVSGSSVSFGTPVAYRSANIENHQSVVFDSNANKVVVFYGRSSTTKAKVGTVSGTSISFGSEASVHNESSVKFDGTFDSANNKVVATYPGNNSYVEAKVGTISGTDITFGTAVVAMSLATDDNRATFDSNRGKVVICSRISTKGRAAVGTVSGTSISFASNVIFADNQTKNLATTFDSSNNKVVIAFQNGSSADEGQAVVGDIDGSGVISFGSAVEYDANANGPQGIAFDSNLNKIVIAYDATDTNKGQVISGTVSGTSITFDSELVFDDSGVTSAACAFDSNANKILIAYQDDGNSYFGTGVVFTPTSIVTTRGQVADGGHALVDTQGAISDNQIGLTPAQSYFVQNDGTLGTTAGSPSVFAGTAVSATKLIVKG